MIIRARPKYFSPVMLTKLSEVAIDENNEELFFSQGRDALRFFLNCYSNYKRRQLIVAMQSFNCEVVFQAALQADCKIVLLDINLHDFSISLKTLSDSKDKIDVLILTHYQGIPNQDYVEIAGYCRKNNILLIDDLAQTELSTINNYKVGDLSDVSLKSFAFDKPIASFRGGSLVIANLQNTYFRDLLLEDYSALPVESESHAWNDLRLLEFLYNYSEETNYFQELNNYASARFFLTTFSEKKTSVLLKSPITKLLNILWTYSTLLFSNNDIMRLHKDKIRLILLQRANFIYDPSEATALEAYFTKLEIDLQQYPGNKIHWNRYSLLDTQQKCRNLLNKAEVEFGNYNWPYSLHKIATSSNRVILQPGGYVNSEIAARDIVNIPIWSHYFEGRVS